MGQHSDEDGDGIADAAQDPQSRAFREASVDDWAGEEVLGEFVRFEPGEGPRIKEPEEFDAEGWDEGREEPKTVEEARQMLRARIASPAAPDTEAHIGAYDDLEG